MLVPRSQLSAVERERDEWRKRAERHPRVRTRTEVVVQRSPLWVRLVAAVWLVLLGLLVGGVAVPRANDRPTLLDDYAACIDEAREVHPPAGDRYRQLAKAMDACGAYERRE